jgi:hypothetical protein
MVEFKLSKDEYVEYLSFKKEKLLQQISEVDKTISELSMNGNAAKVDLKEAVQVNTPSAQTEPSNRKAYPNLINNNTIGWRQYVDRALKTTEGYLYTTQIVELVLTFPELAGKEQVAKKSVGSSLSMNSAPHKDRYLWKKDSRGIKMYAFNKAFKE